MMSDHFWFSDEQWARIELLLPRDTRGMERVDDRRVLSRIVHALKNGSYRATVCARSTAEGDALQPLRALDGALGVGKDFQHTEADVDARFSCEVKSGASGAAGFSCRGATIETMTADRGADASAFGSENASVCLLTGAQRSFDGPWSLSVAAGYERIDRINVDGHRAYSEGNAVHVGAGLQRDSDGVAHLGVSLAAGWQ